VTRALAAALTGLAVAAAAGCGNRTTPDLFALERYGSVPGARLSLRVNDNGQVRCNGGERRRLPDQQVLDAREIARELNEVAPRTLARRPGSILRYRLELEEGTVRFADNSRGQEEAMALTQAFARRVAREVCGLAR
jgi:hypothetical protein